ncbi:helix-turn-helix transcriptional regulator (plasmid) [Rhizobium sp. 32-5/1]|uniref:helix-turn-helix domain-containing protein n=1 Tax=Rhizobium sp. 32-5/1 TaxID=3019602 RepID=UPI00240DDA7C|nr:helix-turn-helix transcriptional regulator [Rhizobium sp. 32-5/1]WEZ85509.1 helix-turn-helix transcriptional regulator [Rhizobium sp. 32-5/1]
MFPKKIPDAIDVYVGGRIRMRRMMLKMSQTRLGDELGITFQQVQKYEKGTNRVGASRLQKIATVMGVTPSFFFHQESDEPINTSGLANFQGLNDVSQFLQSREGMALNQAFLNIADPKIRQKIVALVKAMAQRDEPVLMANEGRSATEATLNS